jgi:capsid protein
VPDNVWNTPLGQSLIEKARAVAVHREQQALAGKKQQRMYAAARTSRLTMAFGTSNSSANAELHSSLRALRDRSRQLVRDSAYAKRARGIVVDNVIGTGIGMQAGVRATRGELRKPVNDAISTAFWDWCRADRCHTGGQLHFCDMERQAMGQVFEAGEIILRLHFSRFGTSAVPLALEIIEAERIADDFAEPGPTASGSKVVQGIEVDDFYRPVAYWLKQQHPGETQFNIRQVDRLERVPADPPATDRPLAAGPWRAVDACRHQQTRRHQRVHRGRDCRRPRRVDVLRHDRIDRRYV